MPGKIWSEEELCYLIAQWGEINIKQICKKLKRSEDAVLLKAWRLNLGSMREGSDNLSINKTAEMLGVSTYMVKSWIFNYDLKYEFKALRDKPEYIIKFVDLMEWLKNNKDKWNANKVPEGNLGIEPEWLIKKRSIDDKKRINAEKRWTEKEEQYLLKLHFAHKTVEWIANDMKRSEMAINARLITLFKSGRMKEYAKKYDKKLKDFSF